MAAVKKLKSTKILFSSFRAIAFVTVTSLKLSAVATIILAFLIIVSIITLWGGVLGWVPVGGSTGGWQRARAVFVLTSDFDLSRNMDFLCPWLIDS